MPAINDVLAANRGALNDVDHSARAGEMVAEPGCRACRAGPRGIGEHGFRRSVTIPDPSRNSALARMQLLRPEVFHRYGPEDCVCDGLAAGGATAAG